MNVGGLIVLTIGIFLLVIALRGTQNQVFPGLFNLSGGTKKPGDLNPVDVCAGVTCPAGQLPIAVFSTCQCAPIAGT